VTRLAASEVEYHPLVTASMTPDQVPFHTALLAHTIAIIDLTRATGALLESLTKQEAARLALAITPLKAAAPQHYVALARVQSLAARKACPHEWEGLAAASRLWRRLDEDRQDTDDPPPHVAAAIDTLHRALTTAADVRLDRP
jgi:hypothetical protein